MDLANLPPVVKSLLPFILIGIFVPSLKVCAENQRIVIFRLKKFLGVKGPGIIISIPFIDSSMKISVGDIGEFLGHGFAKFAGSPIPVTSHEPTSSGTRVKVVKFDSTPEGWSKVVVSK
jgi:hypothetical protein